MSFKENLLQKMKIDRLAEKVAASIGTPDAVRRFDREAMRRMMALSPYTFRRERDLDLFVRTADAGGKRIFVLDNELKLFRGEIADVAMRKSPTVREMISIRNAIKILNDKDIVISRGRETVEGLRDECIAQLDLSFAPEDIDAIAQEGTASLENHYADGVIENLLLLADLLDFVKAPPSLQRAHFTVLSARTSGGNGVDRLGPVVVYAAATNALTFFNDRIDSDDSARVARFRQRMAGDEEADLKGPAVFSWMRDQVLKAD